MSAKTAVKRKSRVREGPSEPIWLTRLIIDSVHETQLRDHGGSSGVRDNGLLESALARPRNKFAYGEQDLWTLAAAYGFGIARNHAFVDGNKRTAFIAAALFLSLNGLELLSPEPEVVDVMNRLASGRITEAAFADWIKAHITRN